MTFGFYKDAKASLARFAKRLKESFDAPASKRINGIPVEDLQSPASALLFKQVFKSRFPGAF